MCNVKCGWMTLGKLCLKKRKKNKQTNKQKTNIKQS